MWSFQSAQTINGISVGEVHPESGRWRKQLNGVGTGQHTFLLSDAVRSRGRDYWRDLFVEIRRTIVASWSGSAVYAGYVTGVSWDADARRLTVDHQELRGIMASRLPFDASVADPAGTAPSGSTSFWGKSKRGIARAVVQTTLRSSNPLRDLPVEVGPDFAGSESWSWQRFKFESAEMMLRQVQDAEGGPDVAFEPAWTSTGLEWRLVTGSPIDAGVFTFFRGVPKSPVVGFKTRSDATGQASTTWGMGDGTEQARLVSVSERPTPVDVPALDLAPGFPTVSSSSRLQALTDERARATQWPVVRFSCELSLEDGQVDPSLIRLGSVLRVYDPGDEWNAADWHEGRVTSVEHTYGSPFLMVGVM